MPQPQLPQTATGGWVQAYRNPLGQTVYSENGDGSVNLTGLYFPDGTYQSTAASGSGVAALDVATHSPSQIPSPLYSPSESPSTINPNIYTQDVNGQWHAQAGVDVTTADGGSGNGPLDPAGTLTWTRRMFARDTLSTTQTFKNAFLSVNHAAGVGTASTNQDRAIGVDMSNVSATIATFSITSNVVTLNVNTMLGTFGTPFQPTMTVRATGLSTGTYLNNQTLTIATVTLTSPGVYAITAPFTHANVGLTTDAGKLDQIIYSMACLQSELDIYGTPQFVSAVDSELRTLSLQCADYTTGSPTAPNYGVGCIRAEYFRQAGNTLWGSVDPSVIKVKVTNNSSSNGSGTFLTGIEVGVDSIGTTPSNTNSRAINVLAPTPAYRFSNNYGIRTGDFGNNPSDRAIFVTGGNTQICGLAKAIVAKSANYTVTVSDCTIVCSGTFTLTLPTTGATGVATGQIFHIINSGVGTITVSSSVNINGATSTTLTTQYQKITVQYDGSQYWIIA